MGRKEEIEQTLDQLIINAEAAKGASLEDFEMAALQKTQESLLSKLITLHETAPLPKKEQFQEKFHTFQKLNSHVYTALGMRKRKKIPYIRSKRKFLKSN